ncbi:MAG: AraC family ligand binding domain-containing protein, partial [Phycisphaeraceae bacterium]|nr:AraC family ligand binding domain-containing protein [Phycisphaeraceae bacterium]
MVEQSFERVYAASDYSAVHLHEYEGRVRIGEQEYELRPGDVTLTPAGVDSSYRLPEPGFHYCIHFHCET